MAVEIKVPELGESVIEATVGRWLKKEGERVKVGEALVEIETDKVNLEVGAELEGVLARIARREGEDVKVGDVLGLIDDAGAGSQPAAPPQAAATVKTADATVQEKPPVPANAAAAEPTVPAGT